MCIGAHVRHNDTGVRFIGIDMTYHNQLYIHKRRHFFCFSLFFQLPVNEVERRMSLYWAIVLESNPVTAVTGVPPYLRGI